MKLYNKLLKREKENSEVKVGLVGSGQMGTDIVSKIRNMPGMEVAIIADIDVDKALKALKFTDLNKNNIKISQNIGEINDYVRNNKRVVTEDALLIPEVEDIDVVIDATGVPELGAELALNSINTKKHIVMMNVETDVCVGPILKQMADNAGVVYTGAAGDEPAAIMELYDFAKSLGFEVVAAGKGKNNPLKPKANPDDLCEKAKEKGTSVHMLTSFVEGTKTMVEMAAVSNATGLTVDKIGMHGPDVKKEKLTHIFTLKEKGGILEEKGIVDYALGNVAPGVFVIITTDDERVKFSLDYSKMGSGPNYLLYRPYHLVSLETPLSAARAVINNQADISPEFGLVSEVITMAKKDLEPGDELDGFGGYTVYGSIAKASKAKEENLLPISLAKGAKVKTSIEEGEKISYDMVEVKKDSVLYELRSLQDRIL